MRLVSDNIFHFGRFLKKHKLILEITLKKLSATQASIQSSFPRGGGRSDREYSGGSGGNSAYSQAQLLFN